ncbi:hypothetical protein OF83DRAFT_1102700 [Amylostereum chailletii]|nr:hypothetical protein OF83DRAFT_1102700 [Amylostereum chailletii]
MSSASSSSEPSTPSYSTSSLPDCSSTPVYTDDEDIGSSSESWISDTTPKASKISGARRDIAEGVAVVTEPATSHAPHSTVAEPVDDSSRPDDLSRSSSPDADEVERLMAQLEDPNRLAGSLTCSSMAAQVGLPDDAPGWLVAQRMNALSEVQEGEDEPLLSDIPSTPPRQKEFRTAQTNGRVTPPLRPVRGTPRRRVRGRFRDVERAKVEAARITHLQMLGIEVD